MRQLRREPFAQTRSKFFRGLVRESRQNHVLHLLRLLGNRSGNSRIRMSVQIHPPRRHRIDDFSSVFCEEPNAFRLLDGNRCRIKGGICKRMPNAQRSAHEQSYCAKAERSKWFMKT